MARTPLPASSRCIRANRVGELNVNGELSVSKVKGADYANTWVAKGALSGPVSESLRLGASAAYYDQDFTSEDPRTGERYQ